MNPARVYYNDVITRVSEEDLVQTRFIEVLVVDDLAWQDDANCRGANADLFFPERGASTRRAKSICSQCQVRDDCLEFALRHGEKFGIWGGLSERERRKIRKQRALAARRAIS
jgi:WhiB family transcriptional regulator, redox-sensing transcriptional regulator